jgi:MoxR-like ATPase
MGKRELLGSRLVEKNLITEEQLQVALERQRISGGRLGYNLTALGFIEKEELEGCLEKVPPPPSSLEETGLDLQFIVDLINKEIVFMGEFTIPMVVDEVKLPPFIVDEALDALRRERLIEVEGADLLYKSSYKFAITDSGRNRAADLLNLCRYAGPAPVSMREYKRQIELQTVMHSVVSQEEFKKAFSHLVITESMLDILGPAVSSGRAIFLYGPPGNGKTIIAEAMGQALPGEIYLPHAVIVGGEIITIYDRSVHVPITDVEQGEYDQRWIRVERPTVMVGGEMTMRTLDLYFNPISKFSEAPLQMKANNGIFLVDDLGRQQMDIESLFNRWIVPLARRTDLLTLHTGRKFEIPFDQLVVFATNIEPKNLVDEAFLRRLRYKVKIDYPTLEEYKKIFVQVCWFNNMDFNEKVFEYLIGKYKENNIPFSACQPRDIVEQIIDHAFYHRLTPELTEEKIDMAWQNLFVM